jgi:hypothetical protein
MATIWLGTGTGWLIAGLTVVNMSLPYVLRGRLLAANGWSIPYLERMRPHYWIGATIAGLTLLHAGLTMTEPMRAGGLYGSGLWIATGGLLIVLGQASVGMRLRTLRGADRLRLRKTHFRIMVGLVVVGLLHILLNAAFMQPLFAA